MTNNGAGAATSIYECPNCQSRDYETCGYMRKCRECSYIWQTFRVEARASVAEDAAPAIDPNFRCAVTDNLCGTDSWSSGFECPCASCQAWLRKYRGENWSAEDAAPATAGEKRYAQRDSEALGEYFYRHVEAMTTEGLHSKAAIAAELAWRDQQIDWLRSAPPPADVKGGEVEAIADTLKNSAMICSSPHLMDAVVQFTDYEWRWLARSVARSRTTDAAATQADNDRIRVAVELGLADATRFGDEFDAGRERAIMFHVVRRHEQLAPSPTEGTPTASDVIGTEKTR